jgi:hypothetical protein
MSLRTFRVGRRLLRNLQSPAAEFEPLCCVLRRGTTILRPLRQVSSFCESVYILELGFYRIAGGALCLGGESWHPSTTI